MNSVAWIGVDWGTTNLRVFAVDRTGVIRSEKSSDKGMIKLTSDAFEGALLELISPWLTTEQQTTVVACGMVGAKQGWCEAPYRPVPISPVPLFGFVRVPTKDARINMCILPGLAQMSPPNVMRGEETQIAGMLAQKAEYSGSVCLPGSHSKWAFVTDGEVKHFTTFMTGELFDVIANQTILRHSVCSNSLDRATLLTAATHAVEEPHSVPEKLFEIRARLLLENTPPDKLRARLSGLLIGQELGLSKRYWKDQAVCVIGSDTNVDLYENVLRALGCAVTTLDARTASLAGLGLAVCNISKEVRNYAS